MAHDQETKLPRGRARSEFEPLWPAEEKLLRSSAEGAVAVIGDGRPACRTDENTVRAKLIRFLALGGDNGTPVHESGVWLRGAWVWGQLDLEGVETKGGLGLLSSTFEEAPKLRDARIRGLLNFDGSRLPGFRGDRLVCDSSLLFGNGFLAVDAVILAGATVSGDVRLRHGAFDASSGIAISAEQIRARGGLYLDDGFRARGRVCLDGAAVGGDVFCRGGSFENIGNDAISADRLKVDGSLYLDGGFGARGSVRLRAAQVDGSLVCRGALFRDSRSYALDASASRIGGSVLFEDGFDAEGEVRLCDANVGGDFSCVCGSFKNGTGSALSLERVQVAGALFLAQLTSSGAVNLRSARVRSLVDDESSWPETLILDRFHYDEFAGSSPVSASARLRWLDRQPAEDSGRDGSSVHFRTQPWLQLRKVLRENLFHIEAQEIGVAFEERKRRCGLIGRSRDRTNLIWRFIFRGAAKGLHWLFGAVAGYGYQPMRFRFWLLSIWLICAAWYFVAARYEAVFVPTEAAIYKANDRICGPPDHVRWTDCKAIKGKYPAFYPAMYSLNVLLPVGNLGQEAAWRPTTVTWSGALAQLAVWFETLFGWFAGIIIVADIPALMKRD